MFSAKDVEVLTRTIWGEARGESEEGMLAVGHVVINRVIRGGWWGDTVEEVCQQPFQFSCWNENDPNRSKLIALNILSPDAGEALWSALTVLLEKHPDNTERSCHYHTRGVTPHWSHGKTAVMEIGSHLFFNDVVQFCLLLVMS